MKEDLFAVFSRAQRLPTRKNAEKWNDAARSGRGDSARKYPDVHGKAVDFITHAIDDGTVYFTVRFTDQTSFRV